MKNNIIVLLIIIFGSHISLKLYAQCNFTVQITKNDVDCYGNATGSAKAIPIGAVSPVKYLWSSGDTTAEAQGLTAQTYFVKVSDDTGCELLEFIEITQPEALKANAVIKDVECYGENTGAISTAPQGGTSPYRYSWSTGETTGAIQNLYAGNYTLLLTDANFCVLNENLTVKQSSEIIIQEDIIDCRAFGYSDGIIEISVSGGQIPYTYQWKKNNTLIDTLQDLYNVSAGIYDLRLTDNLNCQIDKQYIVNEPDKLEANFSIKNPSCNDSEDGAIDLHVKGGVAPYRFIWSKSEVVLSDTTEDLQNLSEGMYRVLITDNNLITIQADTVLVAPNPMVLSLTPTDANCFDSLSGSVKLDLTGGTMPYTFKWSNEATTQNIQNVHAGEYSVLIFDSKGCSLIGKTKVEEPTEIQIISEKRDVTCKDQSDGFVDITVSGGIPPYTYSWSTGSTEEDAENLPGGEYSVTVRDAHNCPMNESYSISVPDIICIWIPSAFTPNGDGINDSWEIRNNFLYPELQVWVFNAEGVEVFHSLKYEQPWDGTRNGYNLPAGTYYYVVDPLNGDEPFKGTVTLVR